jgi:hypothetical protein
MRLLFLFIIIHLEIFPQESYLARLAPEYSITDIEQ